MSKLMRIVTFCLVAVPCHLAGAEAVNLLQFQTSDPAVWNQLKRVSDSLPLRLADLKTLQASGIAEPTLLDIMRTRGLLVLADGATLAELKKGGASDAFVAAVSAYAIAPNSAFKLRLHLQLIDARRTQNDQFLYIEAWHRKSKRQIAFLHADVRRLVDRPGVASVTRRTHDPLLPETIQALRFMTTIESRQFGEIDLRILISPNGGVTTLAKPDGSPIPGTQVKSLKYPPVSLENRCDLSLSARQDQLLPQQLVLQSVELQCRWE